MMETDKFVGIKIVEGEPMAALRGKCISEIPMLFSAASLRSRITILKRYGYPCDQSEAALAELVRVK